MKSKAKNHIKKILKRKNSITLSTVFGQKPTHKIFLKTLLSIVFNFKIVTKLNSINFFKQLFFTAKSYFLIKCIQLLTLSTLHLRDNHHAIFRVKNKKWTSANNLSQNTHLQHSIDIKNTYIKKIIVEIFHFRLRNHTKNEYLKSTNYSIHNLHFKIPIPQKLKLILF